MHVCACFLLLLICCIIRSCPHWRKSVLHCLRYSAAKQVCLGNLLYLNQAYIPLIQYWCASSRQHTCKCRGPHLVNRLPWSFHRSSSCQSDRALLYCSAGPPAFTPSPAGSAPLPLPVPFSQEPLPTEDPSNRDIPFPLLRYEEELLAGLLQLQQHQAGPVSSVEQLLAMQPQCVMPPDLAQHFPGWLPHCLQSTYVCHFPLEYIACNYTQFIT